MGVVAVLILVVGGIVLLGLTTGGSDNDSSNPSQTKAPGGDICSGNTLITYGDDPASVLDPIQVRDTTSSAYVVEIFSGLVTLDLNLKVQPDLASSWDISADRKTYTFHMRDTAVFQSGRPVTAQDIKYSLERAADPKNNSPTVTVYLGDIVGLKDRYAGKAQEISGVKVVDDRTIQIQIEEPEEFFLAELTYPVAFAVDHEQIEKNPRNWTQTPNGSGPFKLASFKPADEIRLVRNDRYYLGVAKLAEVDFELGGGSIVTRYQNNELHIGVVPGADIEDVKSGKSPLSKDYREQPDMAVYYMAFNVKQAPFDDVNMRRAMALAIDREQINNVLLFGSQRIADGILPPEMPGYNESISSIKFDPQKAKDALAASKYAGNVPRITLTYSGAGGDAPQILQALQAQWKQNLGIDVQLQASDPSAFLRDLRKGTFQMVDNGWAADYPDPEDFLDKLFASDSAQNELGYSDPTVDGFLIAARSEQDQTKRYSLYSQAEQKILDDAIIIPTFWPVEHNLVKPCVKDWPQVSMPVPKYRYISIDPNAK